MRSIEQAAYIPGKNSVALRNKVITIHSLFGLANPSPTFANNGYANSQTHESIAGTNNGYAHDTNILIPHHTIHTNWKYFPGLVCLLEVVGVT
jgi:hypothetical protein